LVDEPSICYQIARGHEGERLAIELDAKRFGSLISPGEEPVSVGYVWLGDVNRTRYRPAMFVFAGPASASTPGKSPEGEGPHL